MVSGGNSTGPHTGQLGLQWGGTATKTREIGVMVTGLPSGESWNEKHDIRVWARTVGRFGEWNFERMTHVGYTWGLPTTADYKAWGAYGAEVQSGGGAGAAREGTGPWAGEFYTYLPHRLRGRMFLHRDFDTSGDPHHLAHQTCSGVPPSANVLAVNKACGYGNTLKSTWLFRVIGHEQQHEDGANKCLAEGNAAWRALGQMEGLTGTRQWKVQQDFNEVFEYFFGSRAFEDAMETRTSTALSPVIWEWRDNGAWTLQPLRPVRHNGKDGC